MIFVVGSEMVHRGAARTAIRQLLAAEGKLVGVVLNRVNLDRDRYYYANYYRREYNTYQIAVTPASHLSTPVPAGTPAKPGLPC